MASKQFQPKLLSLELVLTSNRSTMVSCEKIIVFKWELFVSFRHDTNGDVIFIPYATVQCIVPTYSCSVIYGLLQDCYN